MKSLKHRLFLMLLLPVTLLLLFTGISGFIYIRGKLLDDWKEAALLRLQRAAHSIDMRLNLPINWIEMFHQTSNGRGGYAVQEWLLQHLENLEGVARVELKWEKGKGNEPATMGGRRSSMGMGTGQMMRFHRGEISRVTPPSYDATTGQETVSLISHFKDDAGETIGSLNVAVRFDYLMKDIKALSWWQSYTAYLIDRSGRYLAYTKKIQDKRIRLGETNDPLELRILKAVEGEKTSGTFLGRGRPPDRVAGFYKLAKAPWAIVLFAPGKKVLSPIIRFRNYYALGGIACLLLILYLIRSVVGDMVLSIKEIADSSRKVAEGNYANPLPVRRRDEIGRLTESFNTMIKGLKERDFISNTFGRYVDQKIARELIEHPEIAGLGGQKREVAVLMSDIRNFTPLSESLNPEKVISLLNRHFSHLIEVTRKHEGIIVDFFGDGVLVFFDPLDTPLKPVAKRSVLCALEMQADMENVNRELRSEGLPELRMGIGINVGEVIVGNIGSETRAKYGIVGSAVNITQRIQSQAEGGEVVISESVYRYLPEQLIIKDSFSASLKGLQEEVKIYVLKGMKEARD